MAFKVKTTELDECTKVCGNEWRLAKNSLGRTNEVRQQIFADGFLKWSHFKKTIL